jgi:hypothetical protein
MAYKNLVAQGTLINPKETFRHFRDFMCSRNGIADYSSSGIGWTYHDSSYAVSESSISINDYFVMFSAGEDGLRSLYFKVQYVSGYFTILGYLYWNNSTHAGVKSFGAANSWNNTLDTNNILWVYGDLDGFVGITKYGVSTYYGIRGGWCPDSRYSTAITTSASSISAGSSRTVTFTSVPAGWAIGTYLFVSDTVNIERVIISNISGNDVTFTTFVASYLAGCKFQLERTEYFAHIDMGYSIWTFMLMDHSGTQNGSGGPDIITMGIFLGDGLDGTYPIRNIYIKNNTTYMGPIKNQFTASSSLTQESTHTIGSIGYRFFYLVLNTSYYFLVKEV